MVVTICLAIIANAVSAQDSVIAPAKVIHLIAESEFNDDTFHLNGNKSITEKREEIWIVKDDILHVTGKAFGYITNEQKVQRLPLGHRLQMGRENLEATFGSYAGLRSAGSAA